MDQKLSSKDVKTFVLAGKATFTILSLSSGARYTYRISKSEDGKAWFVKLLTGSDNESSYTYIGWFRSDLQLKTSAKSKMTPDSAPFKAIAYLLAHIDKIPEKLQVYHSCHCGRCGRLLTTPESIERGIGPECIKAA